MTKEFILGLIHQGRLADARTWITQINVVDIANWLEELDGNDLLVVFRLLPKDLAAEVFSYVSKERRSLSSNP